MEEILSIIEGIAFFVSIIGAVTFVAFMVMLIRLVWDLSEKETGKDGEEWEKPME